jgi:hypothetical protein
MFSTKFDQRGQQQIDTAIIHPKEIGRSNRRKNAGLSGEFTMRTDPKAQ